ncbi:MAG: DUF4872 domain-containing protein [Dehalococcoidales bacterium]|nr:DUF4872 domain-containing protein [Dehalococcoidales bacterium]
MSLTDLAKARGSRFKPFPPQHAWFNFDFRDKRPPEAGEVREAIREVTTKMLEPPIANRGVKGIRKAATATRQWPRIMSEAKTLLGLGATANQEGVGVFTLAHAASTAAESGNATPLL